MSKIREILNKFNINGHDEIGGTDKDSCHSYVEIYEQLLEPILEKDGSLLEIGIRYGGSIVLWNELLKNCRIFGIDIEDLLHENIREYVKDYPKKITLEFRDAYCKETIDHIKFIYPRGFDVIIDDGPHTEESQLRCIELYLDLLKDDGVLVIEDIQNFESIKVFIENIPESKFFDYEPLVFDLRDKKNRYDDIIFAIKKKVKKEEFIKPLSLAHKKTKIVMISMFKNESKGIRRMLESVYKHIDFYVFQDNGSTDGTPDIVKEFFADKDIPGFIYNVEEGWVGFGWNRDHLLQTCLKTDHGCDWIMKMDCDEYLEVDDDFDWSPFYNTNTESFHVTAQNPGCVYYRAWIWNAKLPWKFQHDPAHEVIYLDNEKGENFERVNLPRGLRMVGTNDGESYTVRTKYITDALKLEERLIREETMLTDTYHFWYIAKSYMDCYAGDFYALGQEHSKEFARRFIFYFKEYLKHMNVSGIHEMSYFSAFSIGLGYKYLKEYEKAIEWFNAAEKYCPVRNEHIVHLAQTYDELQQYDKMLEQTTRLINPERKLPFPDYYFLIDNNIYCDSGDYPQYIHDYALSKISEEKTINSFSIHIQTKPRLWIVDDFYDDPYAVRDFVLQQEFDSNLDYYKGKRTKEQFIIPGTKEAFEKIIGKKITNWTETHGMCGRFQYCTAEDALVYHCDGQTLAGMVYLTPDAPFSCGTSLYAHKDTKLRNENDFEDINVFEGGFYDKSKFELVDTAGNVFNRLVLFDAKCIHSANEYFGTTKENSRLFHLFFFD
jgi:glycosyltransferase involved in cell wall biosynthesis